jgi:hypothetical protein
MPKRCAEDPPLAYWVTNQRAYKKALDRGDSNPKITAARVAKLDKLGFNWAPGTARRGPASSCTAAAYEY